MLGDSLGQKVRNIRKREKMTLKELSEKTGVSISFLSQVELNKSSATLETLRKIADALHIHPSAFFSGGEEQGEVLPFTYEDLSGPVLDASFKPLKVMLKPFENRGQDIQHVGHEFIYVLEGELCITLDDERFVLTAGQSSFYSSMRPHYWRNDTAAPCIFLVVTNG